MKTPKPRKVRARKPKDFIIFLNTDDGLKEFTFQVHGVSSVFYMRKLHTWLGRAIKWMEGR